MGGVDVGGGGGGGRRQTDSEINMIPMIDLLMVTISFLLITAVWTHMARINADAQVPGPPREVEPDKTDPEKQLHVEMRSPDKFVLIWKQAGTVISTVDVPRKDNLRSGPGILNGRVSTLSPSFGPATSPISDKVWTRARSRRRGDRSQRRHALPRFIPRGAITRSVCPRALGPTAGS